MTGSHATVSEGCELTRFAILHFYRHPLLSFQFEGPESERVSTDPLPAALCDVRFAATSRHDELIRAMPVVVFVNSTGYCGQDAQNRQ